MKTFRQYLLNNVLRAPEGEGGEADPPAKSAAELQRESIKVTSTNTALAEGEAAKPAAKEDEADGDGEGDGAAEGAEGAVADAEAEATAAAEAEQKAKDELAAATDPKEKEKIQRRIDRAVAKQKAAEAERDALKLKLEEMGKDGEKLTEADVEERATKKANQTVAQREFDAACERLGKAANKIDKEFDTKITEMAKEIGPVPSAMIGILDDLDNGGEVLAHLVANVDEAEDLYKLPPLKMATALTKLSVKVEAAKKPKPKEFSRVPAPGAAPNTNGRGNTVVLNDNMSAKEWIEARNKDVAEKRKAGRHNLY